MRRARAVVKGTATLLLAVLPACAGPEPLAPLSGATRLVVVGDFGVGTRHEAEVAEAIRRMSGEIDRLITTGDNIYPDGDPAHFGEAWHEPFGWLAEEGVLVSASLGNHDVSAGHDREVMELLSMPSRWYAETVGPVHLVVLDSTSMRSRPQQRFLERTVRAPLPRGTAYRVLVFHHTAFSCSYHGSEPSVQRRWLPVFSQGRVDLVLNGHEHVYQRFGPFSGTTYVVSGGGGAKLHRTEECPAGTPEPRTSRSEFHYLLLEATAERLRLQAISVDGHLMDVTAVKR